MTEIGEVARAGALRATGLKCLRGGRPIRFPLARAFLIPARRQVNAPLDSTLGPGQNLPLGTYSGLSECFSCGGVYLRTPADFGVLRDAASQGRCQEMGQYPLSHNREPNHAAQSASVLFCPPDSFLILESNRPTIFRIVVKGPLVFLSLFIPVVDGVQVSFVCTNFFYLQDSML